MLRDEPRRTFHTTRDYLQACKRNPVETFEQWNLPTSGKTLATFYS
jgi:hypothetical protein